MRKLTLFLATVLMISLSGCADNRPSESNSNTSSSAENEPAESDSNSSSADYSHIAESEQQFGLINAPSGQYTYGPIDPNSELAVHGIFRKTDNGGYDLVIKLSMKERPAFHEDDFLYCLEYSTLTKYDLSADDVEGSAESIKLLPPMSNIRGIHSYDSDYLYVNATLWDEENDRSTLGEYYKIARDGSSYEEIAFEDIPKYE